MCLIGAVLVGMFAFQGPIFAQAELPRVFLQTPYSPPTGGTTWVVNAGGDLQAALNAAVPGDIIQLQAGATFQGHYTLPNKSGTSWIYIQSSGLANLPINVAATGVYRIDLNVTSEFTTSAFHVGIDGVNVTGAFLCPTPAGGERSSSSEREA